MKVVFIGNDKSILTGQNGDAKARMRLMAKHFDKLVIIIFSLKKDNLLPSKDKKLEIYPTNSESRWYFIADSLKILYKHNNFDLISTQDPFISGLVGVIAKFLWRKKLNIQLHNDFFDAPYFRQENLQNYIFFWLGKFNLLFADSIRVVSPKLLQIRKSFFAPVATDLDFFWSPPHKKKYNQVVTIARLSKQKNLPLYFNLALKFPKLKFMVIGEGEDQKILEKNLPKNVFLLGQKSRQEIKNIFAKSDVFVLTSNYEGWGISVVEALASGLPVIMTNTGCAGEVVIDHKTGLVVPVKNLNLLEKATHELREDNTLRLKLVTNGQNLLRSKYSQTKLTSLFVNHLKSGFPERQNT